jgi:hypothetical protein
MKEKPNYILRPSFSLGPREMYTNSDRKIMIFILVAVLVLGAFSFLLGVQNYNGYSEHQELLIKNSFDPFTNLSAVSFGSVQAGPMNAFPGQLINESYFLGTTNPSVSYYEVTVTLNSSSYETLNAFPTYSSSLTPAGYYLLFSFEMPNDQSGMWWNVGYEILPITISTVQEEEMTTMLAQGTQVWMQYPVVSSAGSYMIKGGANFTFTDNVTEIQLYPSNPQGSTIVSAQVNSWRYSAGIIKVNFSLFESVGNSNGPTTPPTMIASVIYYVPIVTKTTGNPVPESGYRITLIQGNGAYLMGVTSNQIAQITNSINQTLSIPISQLNAAVVSINGDVATLQTSYGTMTAKLTSINATITNIDNGMATIETDVGSLQTSLSSLSTTVTSVSAGEMEITTDIGTIFTSLDSLNASFEGMNGTDAIIQTDIGSIETSLNSINATIFSVHQGMIEMNTSIGKIETSLKSVNASLVGISGDTAKIMTSAGEINASLSDLNTSIFAPGGDIPWLNGSYANIETCLGNITGTITNVSNDTASIKTNLGVVTASMDSIKSINSQGSTGDPPSLYELIVIALLGMLIIISSLAMLGSRNTLKIMGDKVK